jgi:hypothetical protein
MLMLLCDVGALEISSAVLVESGILIVLSGAVVRRRFKFSSLSAHKGSLALDAACSVWCSVQGWCAQLGLLV